MLVPTAPMIDDFMRAIPPGKTVDIRAMRHQLAHRHNAEVTCPIYTGYHLRTVAEAALEALDAGLPVDSITPFWRVLDKDSPTTGRLRNGATFVRQRRDSERMA